MLWYFLQSIPYTYSEGPLQGDIAYVVGLILLVCGLWRDAKKKENGWLVLLLGGMLVMASFLLRLHMVAGLFTGHPEHSATATASTIAFTRCVLHTFCVPLMIVIMGSVFRLVQEQIARRRTWWQTGLWLMGIALAAWLCLGVFHSFFRNWGKYDVPQSHEHGEREG